LIRIHESSVYDRAQARGMKMSKSPPGTMKRLKFASALGLLAVVGVIIWLRMPPDEPEPIYNGKRLSDLLEIRWTSLGPPGDIGFTANWEDIEKAVGQIGTNAIPTLLRWSRRSYSESSFKLGVMRILVRQKLVKFPFSTGGAWNAAACYGFQALGTNAQAAVPDLIEVAKGHTPGKRTDAVLSLGYIGPPADAAIPTLLHLTSDTNYYVRTVSFASLGRIHSRPDEVVPILLKGLQDTNQRVQMCAAFAFAGYRSNAVSAIPQLIHSLGATPSATNEESVLRALGSLGPVAEETVPFLLPWTTNADSQIQSAARWAVQRIDPAAATEAGFTNSP
jgi:hypothetical protein